MRQLEGLQRLTHRNPSLKGSPWKLSPREHWIAPEALTYLWGICACTPVSRRILLFTV